MQVSSAEQVPHRQNKCGTKSSAAHPEDSAKKTAPEEDAGETEENVTW